MKDSKTGGILPKILICTGLNAFGLTSGGAATIEKTVNDSKSTK